MRVLLAEDDPLLGDGLRAGLRGRRIGLTLQKPASAETSRGWRPKRSRT